MRNKKFAKLEAEVKALVRQFDKLHKKIDKYLVGKRITVATKYYNGQKYGSSKPSKAGRSWIFQENDWLVLDENSGEILVTPPFGRDSICLSDCIVDDDPVKKLLND